MHDITPYIFHYIFKYSGLFFLTKMLRLVIMEVLGLKSLRNLFKDQANPLLVNEFFKRKQTLELQA